MPKRMTQLRFELLAEGFGVRVHGTALASLPSNPGAHASMRELLARHRVVVFRGLQLDADSLVAIAGCLGTPRRARVSHPSLRPPASHYVFVGAKSASTDAIPTSADAAHRWHLDYSTSASLPGLSLMYAVQAPSPSSRTGFADMAAVYAALPAELKARIAGLRARHYIHPRGVDVNDSALEVAVGWPERAQGVPHPLVMQDAYGVPFLCLPPRDDSPVVGLDEKEGTALLRALWSWVERAGRAWDYEQATGELLIWDNRALLHRRSAWPSDKERLIWFVSTE